MARAMVVDDSRAVRMLITRALRGFGFEVMEAANGRDALEALDAAEAPMELILTDWNMPEMNGLELVKEIRTRTRFAATPVIMVSTETERDQMVVALAAGATEYVMKPFTSESLAGKLRMVGLPV